jgi:hypothetical protein
MHQDLLLLHGLFWFFLLQLYFLIVVGGIAFIFLNMWLFLWVLVDLTNIDDMALIATALYLMIDGEVVESKSQHHPLVAP